MNTSNTSETLSLRAAAALAGVSPSTLSKASARLSDAGARKVGTPPRWEITREQLVAAGFDVEHLERSREHPETPPRTPKETPRETGRAPRGTGRETPADAEWRALFESERARAERAERALEDERRRVDALTGSLMLAVRQLESGRPTAAPEDVVVTAEASPVQPETAVPGRQPKNRSGRRKWWRWG